MKIFNLDLHVSVIADIRQILQAMGHSVTDWSLSGHTWVFGRSPAQVDVIGQGNWKSIDSSMADAFYERYKHDLEQYDAFIVAYAPCFAMLYEKWKKPIIVVACTRYEYPFSNDAGKWEEFNDFLRQKIDAGRIVPLANNKYDAAYAEYFTQRQWKVIPSLCDYTRAPYRPRRDDFGYFSHFKGAPAVAGLIDVSKAFDLSGRRGYAWEELAEFRGIVHIPYNASQMSIFEQYTNNIPLIFPSQQLLQRLHRAHGKEGVLSQLSFNQVDGLPARSAIRHDGRDPNNYVDSSVVMEWMKLADYYDETNMPYISYFDSFEHLAELLRSLDLESISSHMRAHNVQRRDKIYRMWDVVIQRMAQT